MFRALSTLALVAVVAATTLPVRAQEQGCKVLDDASTTAANAGDVDALVALYAPDAVLYTPEAMEARGTAAIRTAYTEMFTTNTVSNASINSTYQTSGDLATGWGTATLTLTPKVGGSPQIITVRVTAVGRRSTARGCTSPITRPSRWGRRGNPAVLQPIRQALRPRVHRRQRGALPHIEAMATLLEDVRLGGDAGITVHLPAASRLAPRNTDRRSRPGETPASHDADAVGVEMPLVSAAPHQAQRAVGVGPGLARGRNTSIDDRYESRRLPAYYSQLHVSLEVSWQALTPVAHVYPVHVWPVPLSPSRRSRYPVRPPRILRSLERSRRPPHCTA